MNIPNFPAQVMTQEGGIHPDLVFMLQQMTISLQKILSQQGYSLPPQNSSIITQLNTPLSIGKIIFNSETGKAMINENGTFKTITTS